ncbi:hypothetical protein [Sutterella wadsworthensis]|uniref:hypothetical protein n=1 Tax=Sutterella wadsworthensis TaxID=40545 RepID=UPI00402AC0AC
MSAILVTGGDLPACSQAALQAVMELRKRIDTDLQPCEFPTEAFRHAGCYVRTCKVPKDTVLAGAVIKVPTVLVIVGHCLVTAGEDVREIEGLAILRGAAGRSQVFRALEDTYLIMFYASSACSLETAEEEFTDEFAQLLSRRTR